MDIRVPYLIDFMEKNLERDLSMSELAAIISVSSSRLRHLFSIETGCSPKQTLSSLRLVRARRLLEESLLSIDEIALKVGWQDRSHFERRFKQQYGLTPAQHRNRERFKLPEVRADIAVEAATK